MLRSTSRVQNNVEQARTVIRHISQNNSELSFLKYDFGNEVQPIPVFKIKLTPFMIREKYKKVLFCERLTFYQKFNFLVNHTVLTPKTLERIQMKLKC